MQDCTAVSSERLREDQRSGLIASGGATSTLSSRADNDRPTNEPPVMTAAKQPRPSTIATTIRMSSTPSTLGWRELEAIWISRRPPFWLRSRQDFQLQPDLYGSLILSFKSPSRRLAVHPVAMSGVRSGLSSRAKTDGDGQTDSCQQRGGSNPMSTPLARAWH